MSSPAPGRRLRLLRTLALLAVLLPALAAAPLGAAEPDRWVPIGPFGGILGPVRVDPADPRTLYVEAPAGLYRSQDLGASWSLYVRRPEVSEPYDNTMLLTAPSDPGTLYGIDGFKLTRTTDAGAHWTRAGELPGGDYRVDLRVDPFSASTLYVVERDNPGIWKSTDGGASWQRIDRPLRRFSRPHAIDLAIDPHRPGTLYAGVSAHGQNRGVYKSTNGGRTWVKNPRLRWAGSSAHYQVMIHPEIPDAIYVDSNSDGGRRLSRSKDGGATWTTSPLETEGLQELQIGGGGILYSLAFRSLDDGLTWTPTWYPPHHLPVTVVAHPTVPGLLFASSDERGLFQSPDGGFSWYPAHQGIAATNVEALAIDPRDSTLYAGVRGSGLFRQRQGEVVWEEIQEGLPFDILHYPTFGRLSFGPDGRLFYPVNRPVGAGGFQVWMTYGDEIHWEILPRPDGISRFENTPLVHPTEPRTLFVSACTDIYGDPCRGFRTQDLGRTWTPLPIRPSIVVVNPSRPATVYALNTQRGRFFKSLDGGTTWAQVAATGLPGTEVVELVTAPSRPDTLYAGTTQGFFRSVDGGRTWTAGTTGLPADTRIYSVVVDPRDAGLLHAVVEWFGGEGVFRSRDGGLSWTRLRRGLPTMPPYSLGTLDLDPRNPDDLYLTTRGSGIYRLTVP